MQLRTKSRVIGTARSPQNLIAAVAFVGKQGMPDVFHVDTNLVGATCLELAVDQAGAFESL